MPLRRVVWLTVIVAVVLAGCGTVGPVKPLKKALPKAVDNLALRQLGTAMVLSWEAPTENQDESPATDLAGFAIYRASYDAANGCPQCREPKKLLRKIDLAWYRSSHPDSKRVYLWDEDIDRVSGYRYKVVPYNSGGEYGAAATVYRCSYPLPPPPRQVVASALDRQVRLRWQAAAQVFGYNVYRCGADGTFTPWPLNHRVLHQLGFDDFQVENGHSYTYAVRSVVNQAGVRVESALSTAITATPHRPE